MKIRKLRVIPLIAFLFASPVMSGSASLELGECMTDSLNGKERKSLGKWIFFGMSAHPEMISYSNITEADRIESDEFVGNLLSRLLTEDCPNQLKRAYNEASSLAIQSAFELVGKVAMQELMTNQDVNLAVSGFEKHMDQDVISALLGED